MKHVKNEDEQPLFDLIISFCQKIITQADYKQGLYQEFIQYKSCKLPIEVDILVNNTVRNSDFNNPKLFDLLTGLLKNQIAFHYTFNKDITNGNTIVYKSDDIIYLKAMFYFWFVI
ncbi:MAG: hypothetical protein U5N85_14005 [Arcicella sp.]|nr:hypothetical protein [Arcicella sp.]